MTSRNNSCSVADAATAGGVVGGRAANVDLENLQPGQQRLVAAKLAARGGASSRTARFRTAFIDITNAVGKGISDGKKSMGVLGVRKVALKASNRLNNNNNNNNNTALNAAVRMQTRAGSVHNGGAANGGVSVVVAGKQQRRSVKRSALGSALAATASELARLSKTRKSKKLRSVPTLSDLPSALTAECSSSSSSSMTSSSDSNTITSGAGLTSSSSLLFVKDSLSDDVTSSLSAAHETCDVTSDVTAEGESAQKVLVDAEIGDKNEIEQVVDEEHNEALTEPTLSNPVTCNSTSTSSTSVVGKQTTAAGVAASLPEGVIDFDAQTDDIYSVSNYVSEVFHYYLQCEECMLVRADYLATTQADLTEMMRAILVDWMVEVQESFELNHETLYTAVRLVDIYLCHVAVSRDTLQLIGATALFIACKFDERLPPPLDDFLYICEDAYTRQEVIDTEVKLLRVVEFRLGLPISYRFLRRYARCCKLSMEVLTLSRYILELSLMEYGFVAVRGSLLAAGALTLALLMKLPDQVAPLMPTIQHYSGYQADEFRAITEQLNNMLHKPANSHLKTIRAKYSHRVFFEVAKVALVKSPLEF